MSYPSKIESLVDVTSGQTLAAGGHAARHNDVNAALVELADVLTVPAADTLAFVPNGVTERMRINNAGLITGTGTSLGAWTAYTPTWTNLTVGSAVQDHYYVQIGKTVHVHGVITFAANTSISGDLLLTFPIAARNANVSRPFGVTQFFDSSSGGAFVGYCNQSGTTTVNLRVINSSGTYATREAVSASIPFTWAVSDTIRYSYTYEAA